MSEFSGWAVVEMFGHAKENRPRHHRSLRRSSVVFAWTLPELVEREFTLEQPEYVDGKWTPGGAGKKRPASPTKTRLLETRPCTR